MKVAIVHDWLTNMGGAERVIEVFHEIFPDAPIYTSIYNPKKVNARFQTMDIKTTFLNELPFSKSKYQAYLPLFPVAFEQLDLTNYDVVISSTTSIGAKGVITRPETVHICYCNTPVRYGWDFYHEYTRDFGKVKKALIAIIMNYLRIYDKVSADRVDYFIGNSQNVAQRIYKHYRRKSHIINPPVSSKDYYVSEKHGEYYLVLSRLVPYKRIDLAVKACTILNRPLKVIGEGPEMKNLKRNAGPTVQFLGRVSDKEIKHYYSSCKAFLFPGEEDFGITPLEAQASGRPVIAYGKGGVLDTVINNETGLFFEKQSVESIVDAIRKFETMNFNPVQIRAHAKTFDEEIFKKKIKNYVLQKKEEHLMKMKSI